MPARGLAVSLEAVRSEPVPQILGEVLGVSECCDLDPDRVAGGVPSEAAAPVAQLPAHISVGGQDLGSLFLEALRANLCVDQPFDLITETALLHEQLRVVVRIRDSFGLELGLDPLELPIAGFQTLPPLYGVRAGPDGVDVLPGSPENPGQIGSGTLEGIQQRVVQVCQLRIVRGAGGGAVQVGNDQFLDTLLHSIQGGLGELEDHVPSPVGPAPAPVVVEYLRLPTLLENLEFPPHVGQGGRTVGPFPSRACLRPRSRAQCEEPVPQLVHTTPQVSAVHLGAVVDNA